MAIESLTVDDFVNIRLEDRDSFEERSVIRAINEAAFGGPDEADLVDKLRADGHAIISLVAELDAGLVGHIMFSRMWIRSQTGALVSAVALAPMAHGWLVPMRYGRQDIRGSGGLADWSWITTADVFGSGSGSEPPDGVRVWRLGGSHGMVTCEPSRSFAANEWMATEFISTTDVTGGYACFLLIGPHSTGVLTRLTSLDLREASLPDGHAAQSSVAHAQGIVLRQDTAGLPVFQILVGRDYGESVWHSILHAGEEFQITPIGVEDVRSL